MWAELADAFVFPVTIPLRLDGVSCEREADAADESHPFSHFSIGVRRLSAKVSARILAQIPHEKPVRTYEAQQGYDYGPPPEVDTGPVVNRRLVSSTRAKRNPGLRMQVLLRHGTRCVLSGWGQLAPDGIHAEVQVCHIHRLVDLGPDEIDNAVPMTGSVHWAFDHHLIAVEDDGRILKSSLLQPGIKATLLDCIQWKPKQALAKTKQYLQRHRAFFVQ
ncbi:HNH endonuclease [Devosia sp. RR2S18]|uniref:HNH endonuclease n=1 Tax=Devosia rhizosphaerae TaxID=3049774 RepID=UPI002540E814|nr:HNH endonuclease [Devosia sp. RR2S18]WIJ25687.1 hypothetical protein QOV41_02660 [Devosia sp. RR2S18]